MDGKKSEDQLLKTDMFDNRVLNTVIKKIIVTTTMFNHDSQTVER